MTDRFSQRTAQYGFVLAGIALVAVLPLGMSNSYWLRIFSMVGIYVMLAQGLNVVAGFAGLLDLSYVAFFGIGGYSFAFLASDHFGLHLPFLLVVPLAGLAAMVCGFVLGSTSIRLKGDYLAIVTLAFAQIFTQLLLNLDRPYNITGGVNGLYNFDVIEIFGFRIMSSAAYAYVIWIAAGIVILGCWRLKRSRFGRGWEAIREDELAAGAMGVNTVMMKLSAFGGGAFIAGLTGAFFASLQDSVFPNSFDFAQLVMVYCMVILGGMGNVIGVVVGAVVLTVLPECLREYGAYRMMAYGGILVALMALRPQGIMGRLAFLGRSTARPDKDTTGTLRASTDLYYQGGVDSAFSPTETPVCTRGDRVVLEVKGLTRHFGGLAALNDLDLTLHEREILSIIGPNGAGKTTVFNTISGLYAPTSGKIMLEGKDVTGLKPYQIARSGIARTFQNLRLFNNMSVLDNARVGRFCRTRSGPFSILLRLPFFRREERDSDVMVHSILSLFGGRLTGYRLEQDVAELSYANRRRVEIARAMATGPKVLLLDEPAAGMNPQETFEIQEFIKKLRDEHGYTILLIEHKLNLVRSVSDRVIVLDYGVKIAEGSYAEVASNPLVVEAYLGRKRSS